MPVHELPNAAAKARVHQLIKVGLAPRQAFVLEAGGWTHAKLSRRGLFTRHQTTTLKDPAATVETLIRKAQLTRPQAELVFKFYID